MRRRSVDTYLIAAGAPFVDPATEQNQHDASFTLAGTSALGAPTLTLHDGADLVGTVLVGNASVPRFGTLEVQGSATLGTNSTTPGPVAAGAIAYGAAGTALDIVLHDGAAPAALTLAGDTTFIASGNLYNAGATVSISGALDASLVLDSGGLTVSNDSTLVVGVPISSPVNATGVLEVSEGGVLELQSSVAVRDSAMLFGGLLRIDDAKHFAAHITQFRSGATLELMGVMAAPPADLPVDSQTKLAEMPLMNGVTLELPYQPYAVTQLDGNSFITVGASVPSNVGGAPGGGTAPIVTVTGVSVPAGSGDTTSGTGTGGTPGSTTSVVSITHTFDPASSPARRSRPRPARWRWRRCAPACACARGRACGRSCGWGSGAWTCAGIRIPRRWRRSASSPMRSGAAARIARCGSVPTMRCSSPAR